MLKPRPYQQDIINKTLETTKSTLIQLPTGGGKTIISKEIAIGLINKFNKKILFIAPKIVLMDQTLETFKGLKPQKVHGSNKFDKNHSILISTLHTASRRVNLNPDVIIIDEVHFGYEKDMLTKIIEYNPNTRIIGLSATPYYENGYPLKGFDVIINDYDLLYMIKNKYLVPLRSFILVKPDLSNVDIIAGDYEINQLSKAMSRNTIIMEIVTTSKPYIEESIKTIIFAVNINHAELLKTAFQKEGFTAEAIHSESEEDDNEVIERFKRGYIKVLVSVYKLTTGFDVPETDLAIIARPTKSQNLYKQMVGRVLRIAPNKKNAILLDCGNVIENLGKPLDPIIPKDELEKSIQKLKCKDCQSENIKLKKSHSNMYWECQDCGHKKELENKNHYKCKNCSKKYSYQDGDFELVNNKLYLNCECGFETEISIATGDEEFREVDSGIDVEINNDELNIKINNINKKDNLTFDNVLEFLLDKYTSIHQEFNIELEKIKTNGLFKNQNNKYDSIDISQKKELDKYCDDILISLKNCDAMQLHNIFNKSIMCNALNPIELIKYFKENCILKKNEQVKEEELLKDINEYKKFDLLELLIESKYLLMNFDIVDKSYKHHFYNIFEFLMKKNQTKKFNYWIHSNIDFEFSNLLKEIDLEFFDNISKYIDSIDIGECFSLTEIFDIDEEKDLLIAFNKLVNDLVILQKHFNEKNIEILLYDKKIDFSFPSFHEVKNFIHKQNFKKFEDWLNYVDSHEKPIAIPYSPREFYSKEWISWEDFLGNENIINEATFDFIEENKPLSSVFGNDLHTLNSNELELMKNYIHYIQNKYLSFEKAKEYVNSLNLKSQKDWDKLVNDNELPKFIHKNPNLFFNKSGWKNWNDWLGIENKQKKIKCDDRLENINYLSYSDAKKYVQQLEIKTIKEWKEFANSEDFPYKSMPKNPEIFYKNKGWYNFGKFLGITKKEMNKQFRQEISKNKNNNDSNKFQIGKNVIHNTFGKGKIIDSVKNGKEQLLTIDFGGEIKKIVSTFLTIIK